MPHAMANCKERRTLNLRPEISDRAGRRSLDWEFGIDSPSTTRAAEGALYGTFALNIERLCSRSMLPLDITVPLVRSTSVRARYIEGGPCSDPRAQ